MVIIEGVGVSYHLLCRPLGDCIAIAQVIDFDIFDIITVCHIDIGIRGIAIACVDLGTRAIRLEGC